jgi:amino acid transporter
MQAKVTGGGAKLARSINAPQYFTLAFGCIVGVAWMIILGDIVGQAGPGGAAVALIIGGLAVLLIAFCYAEVAGVRPAAGGEMVWAYELGGSPACFAIGWTLALLYVATCVFEAISIGAVANMLFPGVTGPLLYTIFGQEVRLGAVVIGIVGALALWVINHRGAKMTARTQEWVTYVRLLLIFGFLAIAIRYADPVNLKPLFASAKPGEGATAFFAVLATAPFWYGGMNVFASASEEAGAPMKVVGRAIVFSVLAAMVFYVALILSVSALVPWRDLLTMKLPAAEAFEAALGQPLIEKAVLATALLGNLTAWNSLLIGGSRVLFALGRANLTAGAFARVHPRFHTPAWAISFISILSIGALFLGRGFILPLVNVSSTCFGLAYFVTCLTLIKLRRADPSASRPYLAPGGIGMARVASVVSLGIIAVTLVQPWFAAKEGATPPEWITIGGWIALGLVIWLLTTGFRRKLPEGVRRERLNGDPAAELERAAG